MRGSSQAPPSPGTMPIFTKLSAQRALATAGDDAEAVAFVTRCFEDDDVTHVAGRVPVRAPENYWLPVPGWDERYQWRGYEAGSLGDPDFDATLRNAVTVTVMSLTMPFVNSLRQQVLSSQEFLQTIVWSKSWKFLKINSL